MNKIKIEGIKTKKNKLKTHSEYEILELAVKSVTNTNYGWITAALILYGCRPNEIFSLEIYPSGKGSVINSDKSTSHTKRREVFALPKDFVSKLNIIDQVTKPFSLDKKKDYEDLKINIFIDEWNNWLGQFKKDLQLQDLRNAWAQRSIKKGISIDVASKSMGISKTEFKLYYL